MSFVVKNGVPASLLKNFFSIDVSRFFLSFYLMFQISFSYKEWGEPVHYVLL